MGSMNVKNKFVTYENEPCSVKGGLNASSKVPGQAAQSPQADMSKNFMPMVKSILPHELSFVRKYRIVGIRNNNYLMVCFI